MDQRQRLTARRRSGLINGMEIDLNCDLGEGCAFDGQLMPLITSASIACGFHAGDPTTALAILRQAGQYGISAGAHPSYPDRENFGRRELACSEDQVFADCVYQVGALAALARTVGVALRHVKPHGALYNQACRDDSYASPVVAAVEQFGLALMGLPGSRLEVHSRGRIPFIPEGFADRRYLPDGSLVPRSRPDAFVKDPEQAVLQVQWLLRDKGVRTLCVHGDNPQALLFVRQLREALLRQGIDIRPYRLEPSC
jgi:5-oxoprolinase (ATP-hydrolysing) subunit A